jgi:hypothetical protein
LSEWPFVPYIAEGWTVEDVAGVFEKHTDVSLTGWQDLARAFLDHLDVPLAVDKDM